MDRERKKLISITCTVIAVCILWIWLFIKAGGWSGIADALTAMVIASIVGFIALGVVMSGVVIATAIVGTATWFLTFGLLTVIFDDVN